MQRITFRSSGAQIHNDTRSYKFRLYEAIRSARVSEILKGENSYGH